MRGPTLRNIRDSTNQRSGRFGGALYVLKEDIFIRVSVDRPDEEETKIKKSKALAGKALWRL